MKTIHDVQHLALLLGISIEYDQDAQLLDMEDAVTGNQGVWNVSRQVGIDDAYNWLRDMEGTRTLFLTRRIASQRRTRNTLLLTKSLGIALIFFTIWGIAALVFHIDLVSAGTIAIVSSLLVFAIVGQSSKPF